MSKSTRLEAKSKIQILKNSDFLYFSVKIGVKKWYKDIA